MTGIIRAIPRISANDKNKNKVIEDKTMEDIASKTDRAKTIQPVGYKNYKNDGKVLASDLYTNEKTIADKRNYEELYYRAR